MSMTYLTSWLSSPQALGLLVALPLLAALSLLAWRARRRARLQFGRMSLLPPTRWLPALLAGAGLAFVAFAAAGPHWGRDKAAIASTARDLVIVLDVSRSMLAETPSRQLRAQRVIADLVNTLKQRGGHRLGLVAFAARSRQIVPLTNDYELVLEAALRQDAARLPADLRPGQGEIISGTRIGAGLRDAVAAHDADPQFRGSQGILLLSDGDDPASDGEWKEGTIAASRAGIPVYVIGVGDPTKSSKIRVGEKFMTFNESPIETRLNEDLLKDIASRTDGVYFPLQTQTLAPGKLFMAILQAAAARPRELQLAEDFQPRFRWFLLPGLLLLTASLFVPHVRRSARAPVEATMIDSGKFAGYSLRPIATSAAACVAIALVSAAPPQADDALRLGNEAFQKKDYETALQYYEQAEVRTHDPGLVAFNKGAAFFRLGKLRQAELCYLRCLQDRAAPLERWLMALYDLGHVLLQRGADTRDAEALTRAAECFEMCYQEAIGNLSLQTDAEYNSELARLLWLNARAETKGDDGNKGSGASPKKDNRKDVSPQGQNPDANPGDANPDSPRPGDPKAAESDKKKLPGAGSAPTLPDTDELQPLDAADAREMLARIIERIEREQTQPAGPATIALGNLKDW